MYDFRDRLRHALLVVYALFSFVCRGCCRGGRVSRTKMLGECMQAPLRTSTHAQQGAQPQPEGQERTHGNQDLSLQINYPKQLQQQSY